MITRLKPNFLMIVCLSILSILVVSCNKNTVFSKYETLADNEWKASNKLTFEVDMQDVKPFHNVYLTVRHSDSYPFNNLFVFLTTKYPDGKTSLDTLEVILADNKGVWLGNGTGDIWDTKTPIKKNVIFPQVGKYTFTFEQGMRSDPLPLIMDFGMVIEKSE